MMLRAVPKEKLIEDFRFEDGEDTGVDVLRLDHVGSSINPLIISSKLPVAIDSRGILSMKLPKDTLVNLLDMTDRVNPKIHSRDVDGVLIRIMTDEANNITSLTLRLFLPSLKWLKVS